MTLLLAALTLLTPAHAKKDRAYTAVRIDLEGKTGLCAGTYQRLDIYGTDDSGKERKIRFGQWKAFDISWDIGPVSNKGVLEMPLDPEGAWGKPGTVQVTALDNAAVTATAQMPASYAGDTVLTREGTMGAGGVARRPSRPAATARTAAPARPATPAPTSRCGRTSPRTPSPAPRSCRRR